MHKYFFFFERGLMTFFGITVTSGFQFCLLWTCFASWTLFWYLLCLGL